MAERIEVNSVKSAWNKVDSLVNWDYVADPESSRNAGYPIYRSTAYTDCWVSDLGDRLEINEHGASVNVWICEDAEAGETIEVEIKTRSFAFSVCCSSAHEALKAIEEASRLANLDISFDEVMSKLVRIKERNLISFEIGCIKASRRHI